MEQSALAGDFFSFFESLNLNFYILVPVFLAVTGLSIGYFKNYQYPANWLKEQLIVLITDIKAAREDENVNQIELKYALNEIFSNSPFKNIWEEYVLSLHEVVNKKEDDLETKRVYATAPAQTFFSKETLIDLQINAGFYRHLPGILTGIGIIGTFTGLVWGLNEFRLDAGLALESLPLLLQEVSSAFVGSGFAILTAIFITYKEKDIINKCYLLVEELNKEMDSIYAMGVGEEYLSRLVAVSEKSPAAMSAFKDEVLSNVSELLTESTRLQIEAQREQNQAIADQVSTAVKRSLEEPMSSLVSALREVRGDQQEAVSDIMERVITGFMTKLGDTVGSQIEGINTSIRSSSEVLDKVHVAMVESIDGITIAGEATAEKMADKIEQTFEKIVMSQEKSNARMMEEQKQVVESMEEAMNAVLSSINDAVISFAIDRKQQMSQYKESYDSLLVAVKDAVDVLSLERLEQIDQDNVRNDNLIKSLDKLYSDLSGSVEKVSSDIKEATFQTSDNFIQIQDLTSQTMAEMKDGASIMRDASAQFTGAGDKLSGLTQAMSHTADTMQTTASSMTAAYAEYDNIRGAVQGQVEQLQEFVDIARRESALSGKLISDVERVAKSLAIAEQQSTKYIESANDVLKQSFQDFGTEMVSQVRNINSESNRQLSTSLHALSGTVDSMVASVTKLRRAA